GVIDSLEKKGLVTRQRTEGARRHVAFSATESGGKLYDGIRYPIQTLFDTRVTGQLAESDCERIASSLEDFVRAIGADQHDGDTPLTTIGPVDPGRVP
ncbi:MAG: hypothetical protein JXB46_05935, partial [Candidatus Eisenbacteria bacterium]|nr:hypothetical protein [Candidatus Eisenbacteria bacterium]